MRNGAFDANQGIAVDDSAFYAINNASITKHDKSSGEAVLQWVGPEDGPIIHLDSDAVRETRQAFAMSIPTQPGTPHATAVGEVHGPGEFVEDL